MSKSKPLDLSNVPNTSVDLTTLGGLTERAVLVSCKISLWGVTKKDEKANKDLADLHQINPAVTKVTKRLLGAQDCPEYKAITEKASQIRSDHYKYTLPWYQNGVQILPNTAYWDYQKAMRTHTQVWPKLVDAFVNRLDDIVKQAAKDLGPLFNQDDYPWAAEMRERFKVVHRFEPLPACGEDWRTSLPSDEVDSMRAQLAEHMRDATQNAQREVYDRLYTAVNEMHERLWDENKRLHNTSFDHLNEMCGVLSKLNILGDPKLETLIHEVKNGLTDKPKNWGDRLKVAERADKIRDDMATMMGMNPTELDIDWEDD